MLTQAPAGQALVFCKTKHGSNRVGQHLERAGIKAAVIHGNKSQGARTQALGDFKAGRVTVLVATDIAARGLDIAQLPLVVNFDLPLVPEDYIHRVGAPAGPARRPRRVAGLAEDRDLLRDIQRLLPAPIEHVAVEGFETASRGSDRPESHRRHAGQPHRRFTSARGGQPRASRQGGASRRRTGY